MCGVLFLQKLKKKSVVTLFLSLFIIKNKVKKNIYIRKININKLFTSEVKYNDRMF